MIRRKRPCEDQWGEDSRKGDSNAALLGYNQGAVTDQEHNGPGRELQEARTKIHTGSDYIVLRPLTLPETTKYMNVVIVS